MPEVVPANALCGSALLMTKLGGCNTVREKIDIAASSARTAGIVLCRVTHI